MRVFANKSELSDALGLPQDDPASFRFLPKYGPAGVVCSRCGKVATLNTTGMGGTGYACRHDGSVLCYPCTDEIQRNDLLNRAGPFYAYLASDGGAVTTWSGGELGKVFALGSSRSGWHRSEIFRFHVRDVHGQWWAGRGAGPGMACTLRPMKNFPGYARA